MGLALIDEAPQQPGVCVCARVRVRVRLRACVRARLRLAALAIEKWAQAAVLLPGLPHVRAPLSSHSPTSA